MAVLGSQLAPRPFAPASLGGVSGKHRPREGSWEALPNLDLLLKSEEGGEVLYACTLLSGVGDTLP